MSEGSHEGMLKCRCKLRNDTPAVRQSLGLHTAIKPAGAMESTTTTDPRTAGGCLWRPFARILVDA